MHLNAAGKIAFDEWVRSGEIRSEINLYEFIVRWGDRPVAPTDGHVTEMNRPTGPDPGSIGALMAGYKSSVTTRINKMNSSPGNKIWQRNYYDHVIRDIQAYTNIKSYIRNNPVNWVGDSYNQG